jgi:deoxyribose-phosphate aldolase
MLVAVDGEVVGVVADAKAMIDAGAERIGASSGAAIVEDYLDNYQ